MLIDRFYNAVFNIDLNSFDVTKDVFPIFVIHDSWKQVPIVKGMFNRDKNDTPVSLLNETISKFFSHYQTYDLRPDFKAGIDIENCFMNISQILVSKNSINMDQVKFYNGVVVYLNKEMVSDPDCLQSISAYAKFIAESFASIHMDISVLIDVDLEITDSRVGGLINKLYRSLNKMTSNMRPENAKYRIFAYKLSTVAGSTSVQSIKNLTEVMLAPMYCSCVGQNNPNIVEINKGLKIDTDNAYHANTGLKWSADTESDTCYYTEWYTVNQVQYNTPRKQFVNEYIFNAVLANVKPLTDDLIMQEFEKILITYDSVSRGYEDTVKHTIMPLLSAAISGAKCVDADIGADVKPEAFSNMLYINLYLNSYIKLIDEILLKHIEKACIELVGYGDKNLRERVYALIKGKLLEDAKTKYSQEYYNYANAFNSANLFSAAERDDFDTQCQCVANAFLYTVFIKRMVNIYETLTPEELVDDAQNNRALMIYNFYAGITLEVQKNINDISGQQKACDILSRMLSIHGNDTNNINALLCERIQKELEINATAHSMGATMDITNVYANSEYVRRCLAEWINYQNNPSNQVAPPLVPEDFIEDIASVGSRATADKPLQCTDAGSGVQVQFKLRKSLLWENTTNGGRA